MNSVHEWIWMMCYDLEKKNQASTIGTKDHSTKYIAEKE